MLDALFYWKLLLEVVAFYVQLAGKNISQMLWFILLKGRQPLETVKNVAKINKGTGILTVIIHLWFPYSQA